MTLTFTDVFCGAGGSSIGLAAAGLELKLAANHWPRAIETHAANFRDAEHLCADVNNYDMHRLPSTDVLWASPICTEISPAGGNRKTRRTPGQLDLSIEAFGKVDKEAYERTRATFHDVIRATEVHRYKAVVVENVPDVVSKWELFDWWVSGMKLLGYNVQFVSASSAHIWGPGNDPAPQWRDRLYLVFTRVGIRLPDVAPRPLAWCQDCGADVNATQWFKKPGPRPVGKYRFQYLYRCPNSTCRHAVVEPYVRPAASVINWDHLGERIGDRKKPLSANTIRRIEVGLAKFGRPAPAMLVPSGGTWNDTATAVGMPARTRTVRDMEALTTPPGAFYVKNYSGHPDHRSKPVSGPFGTITTSDHHGLVVPYYTKGTAKPTSEPFNTVTTLDRFALASADTLALEDCRYRMLQPRESLRTQRFPDSYIVTGNEGEQTMQAGNAVSSNVAQWIGNALAEVL